MSKKLLKTSKAGAARDHSEAVKRELEEDLKKLKRETS
jgi:hypothetical protein